MRLRAKILALVLAVALCTGTLSALLVTPLVHQRMSTVQSDWIATLISGVAEGIVRDTINRNAVHTQETLRTIVADNAVLQYAYVTDFERVLFAHTFDEGFARALAAGGHVREGKEIEYPAYSGRILDIARPVIKGLDANLHLGVNQAPLRRLIRETQVQVAVISILAALVASAVALAVSRKIRDPLNDLSARVRSYRQGEASGTLTLGTAHRDITQLEGTFCQMIEERAKMEKALRVSESKYRALVEQMPAVTYLADLDEIRSTLYVSPRIEQFVGFSAADLQADKKLWAAQIYPADRERVLAEVSKCRTTGQPFTAEYRVVHRGGSVVWVHDHAVIIRDEADQPLLLQGLLFDITADRQAQERHRRREQGLERVDNWAPQFTIEPDKPQAFYEQVCDAVLHLVEADLATMPLIVQADRRFSYRAAAGVASALPIGLSQPLARDELFAWVAKHAQGINIADLGNDPRAPGALTQELGITQALITPLTHQSEVIGGLAAYRKGAPFDDIDEELLTLLGQRVSIAMDNMRVLATLEQRVQERTEELLVANNELESFSYSVSHDLRAPLRSIDGFSRALLEDYADRLDGTGKDYLRRIRGASHRMGKLLTDLLMLSRVTRRDMLRERVNLSALAEETVARLREAQPARQIEWVIEQGLSACGDASLLGVVLENLLDNAQKYTANTTGPRIHFGVTERDNETIFYVQDNGIGFAMQYADKLFQPFQRLHSVDEFEGNGIGLATVARIIRRHAGRVWAEAEVDQGATFYFTLPETETDPAKRAPGS